MWVVVGYGIQRHLCKHAFLSSLFKGRNLNSHLERGQRQLAVGRGSLCYFEFPGLETFSVVPRTVHLVLQS
jgi:hypothetical protein